MTTIVYDHKNKTIAWDSRRTQSGKIISDTIQKNKERNGYSFWLAGDVSSFNKVIDAFFAGGCEEKYDVDGLVLTDSGAVVCIGFCEQAGYWDLELDHSDAFGSGCDWALAALDHGKTAKEAVEYAKTRDCYTGGEVHVLEL